MKSQNGISAILIILGIICLCFYPGVAEDPNQQLQGKIGDAATIEIDDRAERIDTFFRSRKMPLAGYGAEFVAAADKYGNEWELLPAVSVVESSGGIEACGNNPFGWGSCRPGVGSFDSISEAIEYVSMNLGGENPRTRSAYAGGTDADLWSYNGSVEPGYPLKVRRVMEQISGTPLSPPPGMSH